MLWQQGLFAGMAIGYESLKLYLLMETKRLISQSNKFLDRKWWSSTITGIVYVGLAIVSLIAASGFVLVVLNERSENITIANEQLEVYQEEILHGESLELSKLRLEKNSITNRIQNNSSEINSLDSRRNKIPDDFSTNYKYLSSNISDLQDRNEALENTLLDLDTRILELSRLEKEINESKYAKEKLETPKIDTLVVFDYLAKAIGSKITGFWIMTVLLYALMLLLEVAIFITSGNLVEDEKKNLEDELKKEYVNKGNYVRYAESLFPENGVRLRTSTDIAKDTGLPLEECEEIRSNLLTWEFDKKPIMISRQGGTRANFSKENFIRIVKFYSSTPQKITRKGEKNDKK